ncbi:polysaccharide biosynthesis tyrosine autokinase [Paraglaciecola sp.]|uniref:GumC family protein n=1 Tax=Paraglaciecola sp. TaxID=1920173 RepID=UPI0030F3A0A9
MNVQHTKSRYQTQYQQGGFDFADFLAFVWLKKWRIVLTIAVLTTLGSYYVKNLPKIYTATSTILLDEKSDTLTFSGNFGTMSQKESDKLDTFIEFIRARQFMAKIVDQLELHKRVEFQKTLANDSNVVDKQTAITALLRNLKLTKIANTEMLKISVESRLAYTAAEVANAIGPVFFEYQSQTHKRKADETTRWLDSQLTTLRSQLDYAEKELEVFMQVNGLIDLESQVELAKTEISKLIEHSLQLDKSMAADRSTITQIKASQHDIQKLLQVPAIFSDTLLRELSAKLIEKELLFDQISKRYKFKHHKYIAAKSAVELLKENFNFALTQVIDGLQQTYESTLSRQNELAKQMQDSRLKHTALGQHEMELATLRRKVIAMQQLYDVFLSRLQEAEILQDLDSGGEFAIVDYAEVPEFPSKPKVLLGMSFSFILASIFSVGFWLLLHLIADKKTRFKQLLLRQGVAVLAEIPKVPKAKKTAPKSSVNKLSLIKDFVYAEAFRTLRSELVVRSDDTPTRIIAITSVAKEQDASMVAIELAESFGHLEKSILIDANMRAPIVGLHFGMSTKAAGLSDFINRQATFSQCVVRERGNQLAVMPSGTGTSDPLIYLSKPRFGDFVKKLGVLYERLIINTPPVNSFSDALVVAKLVDGIILVCDIEKTDSLALIEAVQRLQDAGAPLLGVVFDRSKNVNPRFSQRQTKALSAKKAS